MKRLSKLHRDAAMLCSARATYAMVCADVDSTTPLQDWKLEEVLEVSTAANRLADRALGSCAWEFVFLARKSKTESITYGVNWALVAMHYALAASVLLNGEVT